MSDMRMKAMQHEWLEVGLRRWCLCCGANHSVSLGLIKRDGSPAIRLDRDGMEYRSDGR